MFQAKIYITFKKSVLDPQGQAAENALHHLGYDKAVNVRVGKFITLDINENQVQNAEKLVNDMCQKLLANLVIEEYQFELKPVE